MIKERICYTQFIDYALLKPTMFPSEVVFECQRAIDYGFYSVCVPPVYVELAQKTVRKSNVKVATVIGFPLGYTDTDTKIFEAQRAVERGASELDIVIQIGWAKARKYQEIKRELALICTHLPKTITTKAILELSYLSQEEKRELILALADSAVDFLKTATGFGPGGATLEDVKMMQRLLKGRKKIKAAGGIKDVQAFLKFIQAGIDRIGTSSGPAIIDKLSSHYK